MKPLLSLLFFVFIYFSMAMGQDTVKKDTSTVKQEKPYKIFLHSLTRRPDVYAREHQQQDSILRAKMHPEMHHPAIYIDGGFGYVIGGLRGAQANYSLNYQDGLSLFTFRGLANGSEKPNPTSRGLLSGLEYETTGTMTEYALMYGLRFNSNIGHAFNFSAGIDHDNRSAYYYDEANNKTQVKGDYIGVPFEANYQWYTRRFGVSFGLKLSGDISRHDFIGIGVDMGLGFHSSH
jgi:hypothetical protein